MGSFRAIEGLSRRFGALVASLVVIVATAPPAFADHVPEPDWFTEADPIAVTSSTGRVRDFERIGDTVYVGGSHVTLRNAVGGTDLGPAYLGAVERTGGQVITSFQPQLDGEVRALARSADGTRLYVGGRFDTVNGEAWPNFVVLDPVTGQRIAGVSIRGGGVDDIQVAADGTVYVGGAFTTINGVTRRRIGAFDGSTGATTAFSPPDPLDTVRSVAISPDGARIYYGGGYTDRPIAEFRGFLHAANPVTGSIDSSFDADVENVEVFDVVAHQDRVYVAEGGLGGLAKAFRTDGSTRGRWRADGDVQVVSVVGNRVVFGGHFIERFGSFDTRILASYAVSDLQWTGDVWFDLRGSQGAWAIFHDEQFLWIGGDINDARPRSVRGFARYSAVSADLEPPTTPGTPLVEATGADELTISWEPSTDDTFFVEYDVYRNGNPWRTVPSAMVADESVAPDQRYEYFVVAVDRTGKESAPSSVGSGWSAPPVETELIGGADRWRYLDTGVPAPAGWFDRAFDDSGWSAGPQILGFGEGDESTVVDSGPNGDRHITTYFRRSFWVPRGSEVFALQLDVEFDDGVVAYLDGVEVARSNIGPGAVTYETRAQDAVDRLRRSFEIDPGALRPGKNVLAVEVHQAAPSSSDLRLTVDLTASMRSPVRLVAKKGLWRYDDDGARDAGWRGAGFDDSAWSEGRAPLGTRPKSATRIDPTATTIYLRFAFTGDDFGPYESLRLRIRDNDGYILHVNGVKIAKVGLPPPPTKPKTEATRDAPNHRWVEYDLPVSLVSPGANLVTIEIHRFEGTGSVLFDASLVVTP